MQRIADTVWVNGSLTCRPTKIRMPKKKTPEKQAYRIIKSYLRECDRFPLVSAEDTAVAVNLSIGMVLKVFMQLNREGILSQAQHSKRDAHWSSDEYQILREF